MSLRSRVRWLELEVGGYDSEAIWTDDKIRDLGKKLKVDEEEILRLWDKCVGGRLPSNEQIGILMEEAMRDREVVEDFNPRYSEQNPGGS